MEVQTEYDQYVLEQLAPLLETGEEVLAIAYLTEIATSGLAFASGNTGWYLALTDRQLIRIQTRVGLRGPKYQNLGVEVDLLQDIEAAIRLRGGALVIRFIDGREKHYLLASGGRYISSQAEFVREILQRFGQGHAAQRLAEAQVVFDVGLREMTPRLIVTPTLLVLNIAVFVLMLIDGVSIMSPSIDNLIKWGADYAPLTTGGEYWRILSCTFVHIGIIHLAFNMWVLWDLGRLVERMVGNVAFACLYLVSGLLASIASLWFSPMVVSAGASGAVFGVAGALIGIVLIDRGAIPARRLSQLRGSVGVFIFYNLVYGFTKANIDQAAHIGGLLAGVICGLILARSATKEGQPQRLRRALLVALLGIVAVPSLALALPTDVADAQKVLDDFAVVEQRVIEKMDNANKHGLSNAEFAVLLRTKVLPDWREAHQRLSALKDLPDGFQKRIDLLVRYSRLRQESWELLLQAIEQNDEDLVKKFDAKRRQAETVLGELKSAG